MYAFTSKNSLGLRRYRRRSSEGDDGMRGGFVVSGKLFRVDMKSLVGLLIESREDPKLTSGWK